MTVTIALGRFETFISACHRTNPNGHAFLSTNGKASQEGLMHFLQQIAGIAHLTITDDTKTFVRMLQQRGHAVHMPKDEALALAICDALVHHNEQFQKRMQLPILLNQRPTFAVKHFQATHTDNNTPITDEVILAYMRDFGFNLLRSHEAYREFIQQLNQTGLTLSTMSALDFAYNAEVHATYYQIINVPSRPEIPEQIARPTLAAYILHKNQTSNAEPLNNEALLEKIMLPVVLRQLEKAPGDILTLAAHLKRLGYPVDADALASDPLTIPLALIKNIDDTRKLNSLLYRMDKTVYMATYLLATIQRAQSAGEVFSGFDCVRDVLRSFMENGKLDNYETLQAVFSLLQPKLTDIGVSSLDDLCTPFQFSWMIECTPTDKLARGVCIPATVDTMTLTTALAKSWLKDRSLTHISNTDLKKVALWLYRRPSQRYFKGYPYGFKYLASYEDWFTLAERLSQAGYTVEEPFLDLMGYAIFTQHDLAIHQVSYDLPPEGVCHITLAANLFSKWIDMLKIELTEPNTHDVRKNLIREALACNNATLKGFMDQRSGYCWIKSYTEYCALAQLLRKRGYTQIASTPCTPEQYNKRIHRFHHDKDYDTHPGLRNSYGAVKPSKTEEKDAPTLRTLCYATLFANASQTDTTGSTELAMAKHAMDPATATGAHPCRAYPSQNGSKSPARQ